jgi:hypothetical protein
VAELALDNQKYAFSVADGGVVDLTILEGAVDWSTQTGGTFAAEGRLTTGETRQFDVSAIISADGPARFDLTYPQPPPPVATAEDSEASEST